MIGRDGFGSSTSSLEPEIVAITSVIERYSEGAFLSEPHVLGHDSSRQEEKLLKVELSKLLHSEPSTRLTFKVVELVECLEKPHLKSVAIEFIPKLCGNSEEENEKVLSVLESTFDSYHDLTRIVISTLYRLDNLTSRQQHRVLQVAQCALESAEEEDLCDIVKIMLKSMSKKNSSEIVSYIRRKLSNDDSAAIGVCTDILSNTFSTNPSSATFFIKSLKSEEAELTKLDVLILLILLSARNRERSTTFNILKNAFLNKPKRLISLFTILDAIVSPSNVVNDKFTNSVYVFVLYMLTNSEVFTDERGISWIHSIFISTFEAYPMLRAKLLTSLLAMFQYNDNRSEVASDILVELCDQKSCDDDGAGMCRELARDFLAILKDALSYATSYSSKYSVIRL